MFCDEPFESHGVTEVELDAVGLPGEPLELEREKCNKNIFVVALSEKIFQGPLQGALTFGRLSWHREGPVANLINTGTGMVQLNKRKKECVRLCVRVRECECVSRAIFQVVS